MSIRYSKSVGVQLATTELVSAALVSFRTHLEEMPEESQEIIKKTAQKIRAIRYQIAGCTDDLTMAKKDAVRYQALIGNIKSILRETLPDHAGLEYMNMLLALVEDVRAASVKFRNRVLAYDWEKLTRLLFDMYLQDDPDLDHTDIDNGLMIANRIKAVMV